jgi:uncharacterized protein YoxC
MSAEILEKLNRMHTDIKLTNERLQNVMGDVHDHETILRGENKMNGLIGDVRSIKTTQRTAHKLWLIMVATFSAVVGWIGLK